MYKNRKRFLAALVMASVVLMSAVGLSPAHDATAAEHIFSNHFISISTDDDVLIMTPDTKKYDEVWEKAGITNSSDTLKSFSQMGVFASFYDPDSSLTVNVISNRKDSTIEFFSFKNKSDEEILKYMNDQMNDTSSSGITTSLEVLRDMGEYPFIRIYIDATATDNPCSEVIYGTVVNGEMLQFDAFHEGKAAVDESFLKEIIGGFKVTRELTLEEYDELASEARNRLVILLVSFIALIAAAIFLIKWFGKRRDAKAKKLSDDVTEFRRKIAAGEISTSGEPLLLIRTSYTKELFSDLGMYLAWIKPEIPFKIAVLIFLLLAGYMAKSGSYLYALIVLAFMIVMLYMHYSASEKTKEAHLKRYDVQSSPKPVFAFYKDYFKISGITGGGEYIYPQITEIHEWKGVIYMFISSTQVFPINKADLAPHSYEELKRIIRQK